MTVSAPVQLAISTTGIVSAATLPAADILRELGITADSGLSSDLLPAAIRGEADGEARAAR